MGTQQQVYFVGVGDIQDQNPPSSAAADAFFATAPAGVPKWVTVLGDNGRMDNDLTGLKTNFSAADWGKYLATTLPIPGNHERDARNGQFAAAATASATVLLVNENTLPADVPPTPFVATVGANGEMIYVTNRVLVSGKQYQWTVQRGINGTAAQAVASGDRSMIPYDGHYRLFNPVVPNIGLHPKPAGWIGADYVAGKFWYSSQLVAPDGHAYWRVILINSVVAYDTETLAFLNAELAAAKTAGQHIIVCYHYPFYTLGGYAPGISSSGKFFDLVAKYTGGLKVIMCGHDHNYVRWNPIRTTNSASSATGQVLVSDADYQGGKEGVVHVVAGGGGASGDAVGSGDQTNVAAKLAGGSAATSVVALILDSDRFTIKGYAPQGTIFDAGKTYIWGGVAPPPGPVITNFSPASGVVGDAVTINGTDLAGATVTFNGVAATVLTNTGVRITTTVPAGATTGRIRVTTSGGFVDSATDFTVTTPPAAPVITNISPLSGKVGVQVTIDGTGFTGCTSVSFNGLAQSTITVVSDTRIRCNVPTGATTGKLTVFHPTNGTSAPSVQTFSVITTTLKTHSTDARLSSITSLLKQHSTDAQIFVSGAIAFTNLGSSTPGVVSNPDLYDVVARATYAVGSWTPPTSGLLCCYVGASAPIGSSSPPPTVTGNGVTWIRIATRSQGVYTLSLYAANAAGAVPGVTQFAFGAAQEDCEVSFFHIAGSDEANGVAQCFVETQTNSQASATAPQITLGAPQLPSSRPISGWLVGVREAMASRAGWTEMDEVR